MPGLKVFRAVRDQPMALEFGHLSKLETRKKTRLVDFFRGSIGFEILDFNIRGSSGKSSEGQANCLSVINMVNWMVNFAVPIGKKATSLAGKI